MQDLLKEESNKRILPANLSHYKYETSGPVLAQTINMSITNIIDEVKKQRMDIIKLNNELKNSKGLIDRRSVDELKNKPDVSHILKGLKKERDQLQVDLKGLKEIVHITEAKLRERDGLINELRIKNSEYLKQLNEKQTEIENLKFNLSRAQTVIEENKPGVNSQVQKELMDEAEGKIKQYFDKYKGETQKNAKLTAELQETKDSFDILVNDNERLNIKLKQYMETNNKLKQELDEIKTKKQNETGEELIIDYNFMKRVRDNMDTIIEYMENTEI